MEAFKLPSIKAPIDDIHPQREARKFAAVEEFDKKRDSIQYSAALGSWQSGDLMGCRESLQAILRRNPEHAESRELLAQVDAMAEGHSDEIPVVAPADRLPASVPDAIENDLAGGSIAPVAYADPIRMPNDFSLEASPVPPAKSPVPVYRYDPNYDGGARTDVARRSVRQAVDALAAGDARAASTYYRAAIASEPSNVDLPVSAASMALRYEQPELAFELAQLAISNFPDDASAYRVLGAVHYRLRDYVGAREALQKSISLDKSHPLSYFLMGSTLRKLGEIEAAKWNFQKAKEIDPNYARGR